MSVRTNLGFGRGGVTKPPLYLSALPCCAGIDNTKAMNRPQMRVFNVSSLSADNDRAFHSQLVKNGADVIENAHRSKGHSEPCDTRRRLGEIRSILGRRSQKSRVHAICGRVNRRIPRPIRSKGDICGGRPRIRAMQQLRTAEKNDPLSSFVHYWLADALADAGRNDEAEAVCEKLAPLNDHKETCFSPPAPVEDAPMM